MTGSSDATDSSLQEWLDNNATLIEPGATIDLYDYITTPGQHTIKATALATGYSESEYSNVLTVTAYSITVKSKHCTVTKSHNLHLSTDEDPEVITITPDDHCILPQSIFVQGASYYTYNQITGEITLYDIFENVTIDVKCISCWVKFSSPNSFTLNVVDNTKYWDGTLEYSTDLTTWSTWDGTTTLSSGGSSGDYYLSLRGTGNTVLSASTASETVAAWITGSNISIGGNMDALLDYSTVTSGGSPSIGAHAYRGLFRGNTSIISCPDLPNMNVTTTYCYAYMFYGCSKIKISATQDTEYTTAYRIPDSGTGTTATNAFYQMFNSTVGTFKTTAVINTTYYTSNTVV